MCLLEPEMPAHCGGAIDPALPFPCLPCYVFDEAAQRFLHWGPNTALRLVRI